VALEDTKKAVSTVELALSAVGIFKSLALLFGMAIIEWARAQQKLAENQADVARADLAVRDKQDAIDIHKGDPDSVIDNFLKH